MSAYQLKTFADIYSAVLEELKIPATDTTQLQRVKRDINLIYQTEVIPYEQWKWLRGYACLQHEARFATGTATVTENSTTVTLTTAPATSRKGYWFAVDGQNDIYRIAQHAANSTTVTLETKFSATTSATANFKIWTDKIPLPADCRETIQITHDYMNESIESLGLQKYRQFTVASPKAEGRPRWSTTSDYKDPDPYSAVSGLPALSTRASSGILKTLVFASSVASYLKVGDRIEIQGASESSYNGQFIIGSLSTTTITYTGRDELKESAVADSSLSLALLNTQGADERYRELWIYPSIYTSRLQLHVDYIKEVASLENDDDEPLMPIGDRVVLLYGALMRAWSRHRNPEEAQRNATLYDRKLQKMAGKIDDSTDFAILKPNKTYLAAKRNSQRTRTSRFLPLGDFGSGGSPGISAGSVGTANTVAGYDSSGDLGSLAFFTISGTNLALSTGGVNALRIGSDVFALTTDQFDNIFTLTSGATGTAFRSRVFASGNTPVTGIQLGSRGEVYRTITSDVTDTGTLAGLGCQASISVPAGVTYTNSSADGVSGIRVNILSNSNGTGTLAIANYSAIKVLVDTTAVTGTKRAIALGGMSGGTNNAEIADNIAFSGSWFINYAGTSASTIGGAIALPTGGVNGLKIGADPFTLTDTQTANIFTITTDVGRTAFRSRMFVNGNTAISNINIGNRGEYYRTVTNDVTDTGIGAGIGAGATVDVASGKTYTLTNAGGISAIRINALTNAGAGSLAIALYQAIQVLPDSTVNTGRKTALRFNGFTGGTVGNAFIADNVSYTGDWFINQSGTSASILGGSLSVSGQSATTITSTATDIALVGNVRISSPGGTQLTSDGTRMVCSTIIRMTALTASTVVGLDSNKDTTSLTYASANTASALVQRDGSGNFSAGTITATLTGTASGNTTYTANNHGVVISGSANVMTVIAPDASTTKVLVSGGSSASPAWGTVAAGAMPALTGDVTSSAGTVATTVAKIQTVTVSGVSGTGNVIFSASPTFSGTVTLPSGSITSSAWDTGTSTFTSNGVAFTAKAPTASPTFTGTVTFPAGTAGTTWGMGTGTGSTADSSIILAIGGTGLSTADQSGIVLAPSYRSTATGSTVALKIAATSQAASYTIPYYIGVFPQDITKGSGSVVTRSIMYYMVDPSAGTNNAIFSDNVSFTTNYFINYTGSQKSSIGGVATFTGQLIGKGTATNDSPAAGYIGEVIESTVSTYANLTTNDDYNNVTSISLTAGDWWVSGTVSMQLNGATVPQEAYAVVLDASNGNQTGAVNGKNTIQADAGAISAARIISISVKPFRVSVASTTTWYLKGRLNRTTGTPQAIGHISAVRIR